MVGPGSFWRGQALLEGPGSFWWGQALWEGPGSFSGAWLYLEGPGSFWWGPGSFGRGLRTRLPKEVCPLTLHNNSELTPEPRVTQTTSLISRLFRRVQALLEGPGSFWWGQALFGRGRALLGGSRLFLVGPGSFWRGQALWEGPGSLGGARLCWWSLALFGGAWLFLVGARLFSEGARLFWEGPTYEATQTSMSLTLHNNTVAHTRTKGSPNSNIERLLQATTDACNTWWVDCWR